MNINVLKFAQFVLALSISAHTFGAHEPAYLSADIKDNNDAAALIKAIDKANDATFAQVESYISQNELAKIVARSDGRDPWSDFILGQELSAYLWKNGDKKLKEQEHVILRAYDDFTGTLRELYNIIK